MYNFLKNLFGFPPNDDWNSRTDFFHGEGNSNENNRTSDGWEEQHNSNNDDFQFSRDFEENHFGFSVFNDPFDVHKFFDEFVRGMQKNMNFFGFHGHPNLYGGKEGSEVNFFNHRVPQFNESQDMVDGCTSLRNFYLKPLDDQRVVTCRKDTDLDGEVKPEDVEKILGQSKSGMELESLKEYSIPKSYSKSVYIRTIRLPDGSIETIKKVRDHTGKEETIITQDHSKSTLGITPSVPSGDASDLSILRKFFSF